MATFNFFGDTFHFFVGAKYYVYKFKDKGKNETLLKFYWLIIFKPINFLIFLALKGINIKLMGFGQK